MSSVELAMVLVNEVLDDPLVQKARVLEEMLRTQSPFTMVRAVELAEAIMNADASRVASTRRRGNTA